MHHFYRFRIASQFINFFNRYNLLHDFVRFKWLKVYNLGYSPIKSNIINTKNAFLISYFVLNSTCTFWTLIYLPFLHCMISPSLMSRTEYSPAITESFYCRFVSNYSKRIFAIWSLGGFGPTNWNSSETAEILTAIAAMWRFFICENRLPLYCTMYIVLLVLFKLEKNLKSCKKVNFLGAYKYIILSNPFFMRF